MSEDNYMKTNYIYSVKEYEAIRAKLAAAESRLIKYSEAAQEVLDFFVEQAKEKGEESVPVVLLNLVPLALAKINGGGG